MKSTLVSLVTGPWLRRPIKCKPSTVCYDALGRSFILPYPSRPVLVTPDLRHASHRLPVRRGWYSRQSLHTQPFAYTALVPCSRSSRRVAINAASSATRHESVCSGEPRHLIRCRPKSRIVARNGQPPYRASTNCRRSSRGSLFRAKARPRVLSASRCQRRHSVQPHPSLQRVCVPCSPAPFA